MPEGHVIHRLARDINNNFAGHHVRVTSPQGRFATEAAQLDGCELTQAVAVGKHLFICFDAPWAIHIHLGLVGKFHFTHGEPRGVVRLRIGLDDSDTYADLKGPQWCRLITAASIPDIADTLGADPILGGPPERRDAVLQQVARSKRTAASVLMDQKLFAGVGNIYRAETLFRLGIDPMTPSREIDAPTPQRRPRRRSLRLPTRWRPLLHLRHPHRTQRHRRTQPLLVSHLPTLSPRHPANARP